MSYGEAWDNYFLPWGACALRCTVPYFLYHTLINSMHISMPHCLVCKHTPLERWCDTIDTWAVRFGGCGFTSWSSSWGVVWSSSWGVLGCLHYWTLIESWLILWCMIGVTTFFFYDSDLQRTLSRAESQVERSFENIREGSSLLERCVKTVELLKDERKRLTDRVKEIDSDLKEVLVCITTGMQWPFFAQCTDSEPNNVHTVLHIHEVPVTLS